jgi:D-alanyl-D-alanine endopeptidase (penicillin-binding protein 7)
MQSAPRELHRLEKIVAVVALLAVLALSVGFAQAAEPRKKSAAEGHAAGEVPLRSGVVLVQDTANGETLLAKNPETVMPIASITKLMTAMVVLDGQLDLSQRVAISGDDLDHLKGTGSRLRPGSVLRRDELLLLALMASENRAAAALARTYPGGSTAFVAAMNAKARTLSMRDTRFADATGLNSANVASAQDLARLVIAAHQYPLIRDYSTRSSATVEALGRSLAYRNTNGLVRNAHWEIGLSKTGFIAEAGRCLVMQVRLAQKDMVVVLLDSWGKHSRIGDANRIKKWLESSAVLARRG